MQQGRDIPKYDCSFRVDPTKLLPSIEVLKDSLCIKSSVVQYVSISGHMLKNSPVCERGSKYIESLYEACSGAHYDNQKNGKHLFVNVVKIVEKCGESKDGSSTYCIQSRHSSKVLVEIMKSVLELECPDAGTNLEFKEDIADVIEE